MRPEQLLEQGAVLAGAHEVSPMSAAVTPAALSRRMSAAVVMPDSLTTGMPAGTSCRRRKVVSRLRVKSFRLRLLMPINRLSAASARSSSRSSCTSTSASMPSDSAWSRNSRSCLQPSRMATMSSTASAPIACASSICSGSMRKSLRSTGRSTAARTIWQVVEANPGKSTSVSTDRAVAPPAR